ncbi:MAG: hypothetical protein A3C84_02990 [Candidatus Ryanbacteria bacterium RIFCSPHIGHO2_02_FULL_48_12]|uniref:Uncharacterized protein n=1 Tax=Candidatus Ryanbacteria bacterium RIFCSPHIGHO2_01_FULL_48_27 TaxID=1802115 RepID=A0A1G2G4V0_9BACT|nr:MAG: hypothetical protein A2756_01460 [Candidatus Ryanbacteria bacterium RIFCSPHIGHO2_01_FULL_48_27]OGZ49066.1 MAG: hypothetical protein A3C84_02990 [Candidatus Ryanbacteria bacterium RIFCSPHIGHO2_02_FULL_48_12]
MVAEHTPTAEWARCAKHRRMRGNQFVWFKINGSLRRIQAKIEIPEEPCDLCLAEAKAQAETANGHYKH